jgi:hypothetical protein
MGKLLLNLQKKIFYGFTFNSNYSCNGFGKL